MQSRSRSEEQKTRKTDKKTKERCITEVHKMNIRSTTEVQQRPYTKLIIHNTQNISSF